MKVNNIVLTAITFIALNVNSVAKPNPTSFSNTVEAQNTTLNTKCDLGALNDSGSKLSINKVSGRNKESIVRKSINNPDLLHTKISQVSISTISDNCDSNSVSLHDKKGRNEFATGL